MFLSPSHFVREILLIFYLLTSFVCVLRNKLQPALRSRSHLNLMECGRIHFRVDTSLYFVRLSDSVVGGD